MKPNWMKRAWFNSLYAEGVQSKRTEQRWVMVTENSLDFRKEMLIHGKLYKLHSTVDIDDFVIGEEATAVITEGIITALRKGNP